MIIAIFVIFAICISFSFVEERIQERDKIILFVLIGIGMILIAGTRDIHDTPDSNNYERMFYSARTLDSGLREPSFTLIAYSLNELGFGINALFFVYAIMSIPLRLHIIWKMSTMPLITLAIYISHYYQLHDLIQIRTAVASALFLFAVYYRVEKNNKFANIKNARSKRNKIPMPYKNAEIDTIISPRPRKNIYNYHYISIILYRFTLIVI